MQHATKAVITRVEERPREGWDDPKRGTFWWYTLFDQAVTPTAGLTAGVAEVQPGEGGNLHHHAQPEIYYILEGTGVLTLDGAERIVTPGDAIFIPGDSWHSLRNEGTARVRLFYVFPADTLDDVVYNFTSS